MSELMIRKHTLPPKKDKSLTFRITRYLYDVLASAAKENDITISGVLDLILKDYLEIQEGFGKKARYFNTCGEERQAEIVRQENALPAEFRQFVASLTYYPDGETLDKDEFQRLNSTLKTKEEES